MESLFLCPICSAPLRRGERTYTCPSGHSYDIAREGYVHLLPPNRKHSKSPGDDKAMVAARNRFLSAGYYAPLQEELARLALRYAPSGRTVLVDLGLWGGLLHRRGGLRPAGLRPGCGGSWRGYLKIRPALCRPAGARGRVRGGLGLPSAPARPVRPPAPQLLLPHGCGGVRPGPPAGGVLLYVVPAPQHLWELKEVLYDAPYPNPDEQIPYEGFALLEVCPVETLLHIEHPEDLCALFQMTPYVWNTPRAGGGADGGTLPSGGARRLPGPRIPAGMRA